MASSINGGANPHFALMQKHASISNQKLVDEQTSEAADAAKQLENAQADAVAMSTDELADMAEFVSQQRRGRGWDKKSGEVSEGFERVLEDDPQPKVNQLLKLAESPQNDIGKLLQFAMSKFPDESDLVMILRELLKRKKMSRTQRKQLEKVLQQVEENADPKRLKGGINCSLKARLQASQMRVSAKALRETYREFLTNDDHGASTYQAWIEQYGFGPRYQVVDFIQSALAFDMYSVDPSCSVLEFGALLGGILDVQAYRSADEAFLRELLRADLIRRAEKTQGDLVMVMLDGLQLPTELSTILADALADITKVATFREKAELTQMVLRAFSVIPVDLFFSSDARDHMLTELRNLAEIARQLELEEQRAARLANVRR